MMKRGRKQMAVVLCICVIGFLGLLPVKAEDSGSVFHVNLTGKYHEGVAREVLKAVNAEREEAGAEALVMTDKLEEMAKQRAAEVLVLRDHQRPNGLGFETLAEELGLTYQIIDENLSEEEAMTAEAGSEGVETVNKESYADGIVWAWMHEFEEKILNTEFTHAGVGCFEFNGRKSCVIVYAGQPSDTKEAPTEGADHIEATAVVTVDAGTFEGGALDFEQREEKVNPGTEVKLDIIGLFGNEAMAVEPGDITFESSSDSVAVQDSRIVISPEAEGEVILTAKVGIYTAEKKLIITDEAVMEAQDSAETGDERRMGYAVVSLIGCMMILTGYGIREKKKRCGK